MTTNSPENRLCVTAMVFAITVLLGGCSKAPEPSTQASAASAAKLPSKPVKYANLAQFKGKVPGDLLGDIEIGKTIREIVSKEQVECMNTLFKKHMPVLDFRVDGSLVSKMIQSSQTGESQYDAFISVTPAGDVNIVLQCDLEERPQGGSRYHYFSNAGILAPAPADVQEWLGEAGTPDLILSGGGGFKTLVLGTPIVKSNGKETLELPYEDFMEANKKESGNIVIPTLNKSNIVGDWSCSLVATTKPMSVGGHGSYSLEEDGNFSMFASGGRYIGKYLINPAPGSREITVRYTRLEYPNMTYENNGLEIKNKDGSLFEERIVFNTVSNDALSFKHGFDGLIGLLNCERTQFKKPMASDDGGTSQACYTYFAALDQSSAPVHLRQMQAKAAGCKGYEPQ